MKKNLLLAFVFVSIFGINSSYSAEQKIHKVWIWQETGDSLWNLAIKYYGDGTKWKYIYEANKETIKDPRKIYPRQKIIIPSLEEISSGAYNPEPKQATEEPAIIISSQPAETTDITVQESTITEPTPVVTPEKTEVIKKEDIEEPRDKITDTEKQKALQALDEMDDK